MDVLDRILKTFDHEEPDRVPSFLEGMMGIFKDNFMMKYEDEIEDDQVLFGSYGDLTVYKYYKVDSVWLHSSPIRWGPVNIDLGAIDLEDDNYRINRFGQIFAITTVMGRGHNYC